MATDFRQRTDGTWTRTSEAWDQSWYWPVGTRVVIQRGHGAGVIVKQNAVTVHVRLDSGSVIKVGKSADIMERENS